MLKLGRVTKVKVPFLVLVFVFNFDLFKFSAAILEKGLLLCPHMSMGLRLVALPWPFGPPELRIIEFRYLSPAVKKKHIALKFSRKPGDHVV